MTLREAGELLEHQMIAEKRDDVKLALAIAIDKLMFCQQIANSLMQVGEEGLKSIEKMANG